MGAQNIAKIVLVLGIIVGFTTLLYGEMGIPGGPPAISVPTYPVFSNPFASGAAGTATFVLDPVGSDGSVCDWTAPCRPESVNNPGTVAENCYGSPPVRWDGCVAKTNNLADGVYLHLSSARTTFTVKLREISAIIGDAVVGSVTFHYTCRYTTTQYKTDVDFFDYTGHPVTTNVIDMPKCDSTFSLRTFTINFVSGSYPRAASFNAGYVSFHEEIAVAGPTADFNFVQVVIDPPPAPDCDVWCQIANGFRFLYNLGVLLVNVGIFVFQWILLAVSVIGGIFGVVAWFLAIPGMPLPIQVVIDAMATTWMITLILEIIYIVRGREG